MRIGSVQIVKFDAIGREPPQAFLTLSAQRGRGAINHLPPIGTPLDASLGGDDKSLSPTRQGTGNQPLAFAHHAVGIGGIEKVNSQVEAGQDRGQAFGILNARRRHAGHRPAAERDARNL